MPFQVGWDIVHQCNLRCKHCYFSQEQLADSRSLTREEALRFIRHLGERKVFHLSIAGGEPLLCPFLEDVIAEASRFRIVTALSTNATLLTSQRARSLFDAGLRSLQISLEGSTAGLHDRIRGVGSFERAIAGLRSGVSAGFSVLIAVVLLKANADDMPALFELAFRERATGVKVQTLLEAGLGADNWSAIAISDEELVDRIRELWLQKRRWNRELNIMLPLVPGVLAEAREAPEYYYRDVSCLGCQPGLTTVRVNNLGDVRACGSQLSDTLPVGNVLQKPLQAIWVESEEIARWRNASNVSRGLSATSCGSVCGKGCRAASAPEFAKTP